MRRRPFKPMLLAFPLLLLAGIAIAGDRVVRRLDNRSDRIDNASIAAANASTVAKIGGIKLAR